MEIGVRELKQGIEEGWITPPLNESKDPFKDFPPLEINKTHLSSLEILRIDRDDES